MTSSRASGNRFRWRIIWLCALARCISGCSDRVAHTSKISRTRTSKSARPLWMHWPRGGGRTTTLAFAVIPQRLARFGRQRCPNFGHELFAGFIHADHWVLEFIGALVDFLYVLYPPHQFRIMFFRNTPLFSQPGFDRICFKV